MKKVIIIEVLLLFVLAVSLAITVIYWRSIADVYQFINEGGFSESSYEIVFESIINTNLPYAIISLLACLADIAAIIIIALKDIPVFKPIAEKLASSKERRAQKKSERAKAEKQAKLQELEQQIEELKQDIQNN